MNKDELIIREIKANPDLNRIYTKAAEGKSLSNAELGLILPYLPEFRESMEKAEHARAEGRTVRAEEALASLRKLDAQMVANLPVQVLKDLRIVVYYALYGPLTYSASEEDIEAVTWFDQVVTEALEHAEEP